MVQRFSLGLALVLMLAYGINIAHAQLSVSISPSSPVINAGQSVVLNSNLNATNTTPPYTYVWYPKNSSDQYGSSGTCAEFGVISPLSANNTFTVNPSVTTGYCLQVSDQFSDTAANVVIVQVIPGSGNAITTTTTTINSAKNGTTSTASSTSSVASSTTVNQSIPAPEASTKFSNSANVIINVTYNPRINGNVIVSNVLSAPSNPKGYYPLSIFSISTDASANKVVNVTATYNCALPANLVVFLVQRSNNTWQLFNLSFIDPAACSLNFTIPANSVVGIMAPANNLQTPLAVPTNTANSSSVANAARPGLASEPASANSNPNGVNSTILVILVVGLVTAMVIGYMLERRGKKPKRSSVA